MGKSASYRSHQLGRTFLKEWRLYRGFTLDGLAERMGTSHANLSRVERGKSPYNQYVLEHLADVLRTDPASLLSREPNATEEIWAIWEQASPEQRQMLTEIAKIVTRPRLRSSGLAGVFPRKLVH